MKPRPWNPPSTKPKRPGWYRALFKKYDLLRYWDGNNWWGFPSPVKPILFPSEPPDKWRGPARKEPHT